MKKKREDSRWTKVIAVYDRHLFFIVFVDSITGDLASARFHAIFINYSQRFTTSQKFILQSSFIQTH